MHKKKHPKHMVRAHLFVAVLTCHCQEPVTVIVLDVDLDGATLQQLFYLANPSVSNQRKYVDFGFGLSPLESSLCALVLLPAISLATNDGVRDRRVAGKPPEVSGAVV